MRIFNIGLLFIFLCITNLAFAKNKIYLANNTASVAIAPTAESSFNLQITLKLQDNFTNWDLGFFMLKVFLNQNKSTYTAQVCGQGACVPLILDTISLAPANNVTDYLRPELSSGHITLFKPIRPFMLEDGYTYVV